MKPTLLVLAAGMGSRYGGVKQIDAVGLHNECLLDYATFDAMRSGFGKVVYIIRKDIEADFRERLFDRVARNFDAEYVFQTPESLFTQEQLGKIAPDRKKPWGTLHAVLCAEDVLKTPFAVINADDYYGRDAIQTIGKHLAAQTSDSTEQAAVGYVLENTMSPSGSVSRGICTEKNGELIAIHENTKIYYEDGKVISELEDGKHILTGKEWVSMNLFGFTLSAFDTFHRYWDNFTATKIGEIKSEALLPEAAAQIYTDGKGSIKFYNSHEKWFGMTYSEDRENVKKAIAEKTRTGYYPEKLWEK